MIVWVKIKANYYKTDNQAMQNILFKIQRRIKNKKRHNETPKTLRTIVIINFFSTRKTTKCGWTYRYIQIVLKETIDFTFWLFPVFEIIIVPRWIQMCFCISYHKFSYSWAVVVFITSNKDNLLESPLGGALKITCQQVNKVKLTHAYANRLKNRQGRQEATKLKLERRSFSFPQPGT